MSDNVTEKGEILKTATKRNETQTGETKHLTIQIKKLNIKENLKKKKKVCIKREKDTGTNETVSDKYKISKN